jgi:hypothetical protein
MKMIIVLMTETENNSETSVDFYQTTRHSISEDKSFHTRLRENLKSRLQLESLGIGN